LYKFIHAAEKLSVQVHPGAGSALGEAKTEAWYVVDAAPGASLIVGVASQGRSREEVLALLESPRCEEALRRHPVKKGDVFFIPAGTVHAITEDLLLYEVQQNSDTTFRLYDWGRVDAAGKARPLHLDEAARVADLQEREGYRIPFLRVEREGYFEDYLVACPYFALQRRHGFRKEAMLKTQGAFRVLTVVGGECALRWETDQMRLLLGETALIPASLAEVCVDALPEAEILVSFVPEFERDIRKPLRAAGYGESEIARLSGPPGISI
jgi:mannose-6-phosphate isomerase